MRALRMLKIMDLFRVRESVVANKTSECERRLNFLEGFVHCFGSIDLKNKQDEMRQTNGHSDEYEVLRSSRVPSWECDQDDC